jgi:copper chaperone CopZ
MKNIIITLAISAFFISNSAAQKSVEKITFEVGGVCDMCKKRIEGAVDTVGVKSAVYELETHQLTIVYRTDKVNEADFHRMLNAKGHDTEKSKASDKQYNNIHECCQYREHKHNH